MGQTPIVTTTLSASPRDRKESFLTGQTLAITDIDLNERLLRPLVTHLSDGFDLQNGQIMRSVTRLPQ
jgi:hypothetical protein